MLAQSTIEAVKNLPIIDVVGRYIKLKVSGQKAVGCCEFHNEKTPSFNISNAKGIFKCFGCGASGDAISFVMQKEKLTFLQAVESIAKQHNIDVEFTKSEDGIAFAKRQSIQAEQSQAITIAIDYYHQQLIKLPTDHPVIDHLVNVRGYNWYTIKKWQLGWCNPDWRQITEKLVSLNLYEAAKSIGIIKTGSDNSHYDAYRSRIIFPIENHFGRMVGMGGRWMPTTEKDKAYPNAPKYINSSDSADGIYKKDQLLYGLCKAQRAIKRAGFAALVEGYTDTISMHGYGDQHTVATCGTALTIQQAQLLKKYTSHVVLLRDADEAGQKATNRDIPILLQEGLKVSVGQIPDAKDPDAFIQSIKSAA